MKLNGGPLKQGRFKGYALMKKVARGALPTDACWNGTLPTTGVSKGGPLKIVS